MLFFTLCSGNTRLLFDTIVFAVSIIPIIFLLGQTHRFSDSRKACVCFVCERVLVYGCTTDDWWCGALRDWIDSVV